jgi:hypothetical protein
LIHHHHGCLFVCFYIIIIIIWQGCGKCDRHMCCFCVCIFFLLSLFFFGLFVCLSNYNGKARFILKWAHPTLSWPIYDIYI